MWELSLFHFLSIKEDVSKNAPTQNFFWNFLAQDVQKKYNEKTASYNSDGI